HIKEGRFENISADLGMLPAGIPITNESDKFAVPGLIDMHVHMARSEPGADINLAPLYLAHGVTSVRDVGSDLYALKQMRSKIKQGRVPGPSVFFCGPQLNGKSFRPGMVNLQDEAEARATVRELCRQGVHGIKIYDQLSPDLARAVINETWEEGLMVSGHLGKTTASQAIGFGIGCLEHLTSLVFELLGQEQPNPFSQDVFKRIVQLDLADPGVKSLCASVVKAEICIDPTMVVYDRIARSDSAERWQSDCALVPEELRRYWSDRMGGFTRNWSADDFASARAA